MTRVAFYFLSVTVCAVTVFILITTPWWIIPTILMVWAYTGYVFEGLKHHD